MNHKKPAKQIDTNGSELNIIISMQIQLNRKELKMECFIEIKYMFSIKWKWVN